MRSTFEETVLHETSVFGNVDVFLFFFEGDVGCFRTDFDEFVRILAWNLDAKCCQGLN